MNEKRKKSTDELLVEIISKLDKIIAINAIHGRTEDEKIIILKKSGFTSKEVGDLLSLKESAVRNRRAWNKT